MPFIRDKKKLSGKLILDDPIIYLFFVILLMSLF
jgi:hypothetical protein